MVVGLVAQNYLSPEAQTFVANTFTNKSATLSSEATWPDIVKHTAGYGWSAPLHFFDTTDDPSKGNCAVKASDCPAAGCLTTAIANYTERVTDTSVGALEQDYALRFLTHFFGDATQPLHVCGIYVGGNSVDVKFDGATTDQYGNLNLHAIWDTNMPEKHISNDYSGSLTNWANDLVQRIDSGDLKANSSGWISCTNPTAQMKRRSLYPTLAKRDLQCPLEWMTQANAFDCSYVWQGYPFTGVDLGGAYYTGAVPVIDNQVAAGGYRLAAWLNAIVANQGGGGGTTTTTSTTSTSTPTTSSTKTTSTTSTTTSSSPTSTPTGGACTAGDEQCLPSKSATSWQLCTSSGTWRNEGCTSGHTCQQNGNKINCVAS